MAGVDEDKMDSTPGFDGTKRKTMASSPSPIPLENKRSDQRVRGSQGTHKQVSGNTFVKRWSFKISTTRPKGFDSPQVILQSFADHGTDIRFRSMKLGHTRKLILLKVDEEHEARIFNSMEKHLPTVANEFDTDLKIQYWKDYVEKQDPASQHVVLHDVPNFLDEEDILDKLEEQYGENIEKVVRMKSKKTGKDTPMVRIMCKNDHTAISILSNGITLCGAVLKGEKAWTTPKITRCYRCQEVDHTQHDCKKTRKCGKCAEEHNTENCPTTDKTEWRCANCNGTHGVWYHGCPCNIDHIRELRIRENIIPGPVNVATATERATNTFPAPSQMTQTFATMTSGNPPQASASAPTYDQSTLVSIIEDLKKTMVTMEKNFTAQIKTLTEEMKTLRDENARLTQQLGIQKDLQVQTRMNSDNIREVYSEICKMDEKLQNIEDQAEERHEALMQHMSTIDEKLKVKDTEERTEERHEAITDELHWITAKLCGAITDAKLRTTHDLRCKSKLSNKKAQEARLKSQPPPTGNQVKPGKPRINRTHQTELELVPIPTTGTEATNNQQNDG